MKYLFLGLLMTPLVAFAGGDYETVFVPDNKKLVLLPKHVENCVVVKPVKFLLPRFEQQDEPDYSQCDKLVVSPTRLPDYCFDRD